MPTTYSKMTAGDVLQNAPISPATQSFFAQKSGLFCNNACACETPDSVDYGATMTMSVAPGNVRHYPTSLTFELNGVSITETFPEPIDITIPANQPAFEAALLAILQKYLAGQANLDVDVTIASGLATAVEVTFSASEQFVPTNIKFLNQLNAEQTANFAVIP